MVWCLVLAPASSAQNTSCCSSDICRVQHHHALPEAPKPKPDRKVFWLGSAALAASKTADAITTRQLLDRGGWENNPLLGRHPSNGRLAGVAASQFAAQVLLFHFTERNRHPLVRWLGRAYIGFAIGQHARLAACNAGINTRSVGVQNCRVLF